MRQHFSALLYCGLVTTALMAAPALVQPAQAGTAAAQAEDPATEVIVTARKRTEILQNVPLSISAIGAADLDRRGVQDVSGLTAEVPGLFTVPGSVSATSDLTYLTMRGVGFNAGLEPAVGVFIDGMYQPQIGFDTATYDLQRVEVLRGPQGTVFGRNTQGGAINMITRKPGPETHGKLGIDASSFGTLRAQASIDGQVADKLYAGVSAIYGRSDGFIYNPVLNQRQDDYEQSAVRGTLRWVPHAGLDFTLMADASKRNYNEAVRGVRLAGNHRETYIDQDQPDSKTNHGAQLNVNDQINDHLTFTSITGYRYSDSDNFLDMDNRISTGGSEILPANAPLAPSPVTTKGATLAAQVDQSFTSQEFRLAGDGEKLNWLTGIYLFEQVQNQARQRQAGPGAVPTVPSAFYIRERFKDVRKGAAAFGQVSYSPVPKVELTLGARYSQEKVDGTGIKVSVFGNPLNRAAPLVRDGHPDFHNLSWMASASYKFTPDVSAYATYSEGWKAGGVERYPGRADNLVYDPENSTNYEVGLKSLLWQKRLTLNLAAYHIDIQHQQLNNVIPDPKGGPVPIPVIDAASHSHVDGFEGEFALRPASTVQIKGSLAYSRGVFDDFVRVFSPTDTFNMSGTPFENVPQFTGYSSVVYSPTVAGRKIDLAAEYSYVGKIIFQDNTRKSKAKDQLTTPAYDRVNLSAAVNLPSGVRVTLYVNNALNAFDYSYASSDPFLGGDVFVVPLAPRQIGVRISKNF